MMLVRQAFEELTGALTSIHGEREATNLARLVLEDGLKLSPARGDILMDANSVQRFREIFQRLLQHEPLQYILQEAPFYGLVLKVTPDVLIPRPETEELVYWAKEKAGTRITGTALDIGTGSGCIALGLKKLLPDWQIHACDVSPAALGVASENASTLGLPVHFHLVDILQTSTESSLPPVLDLLISNPPYIPPGEKKYMPPHVLDYEPHLALFTPEEDPLVFYRAIVRFAAKHLHKAGWLLMECNEWNAEQVLEMLHHSGFQNAEIGLDMQGKKRMVCAEAIIPSGS